MNYGSQVGGKYKSLREVADIFKSRYAGSDNNYETLWKHYKNLRLLEMDLINIATILWHNNLSNYIL